MQSINLINSSKIKRARVSKENVYNADLADKVLDKLTAAETRRKQFEELQLKKLKEHAEHAKAVREKKALEEDVVVCN